MSVKYSIIVPNYNHAKFLKRRLDSVINQTYNDFELIILDDNSNDASKKIINEYKSHPKISHIVFNEVNSGSAFNQWKIGLSLAKGEYVWIAESDDYSEVSFLEEMNDILNLNCEIAFCQSIMFIDNKIAYQSMSDMLGKVHFGSDFLKKRMSFNNSLFNASMVVFKRELIKYVDFDKLDGFKFCGDWFFWIQLLENSNIGESAKTLNYFRKHSSDLSGKSNLNGVMLMEFLKIQKFLLEITMISKTEYFRNILQKMDNIKKSNLNSTENSQIIRKYNSEIPRIFRFKYSIRKKVSLIIKIIRCFRS